MSEQEKTEIKFSEKFSLKMRKIFISSRWLTLLLVLVLIGAFVGLNVWVNTLELPEIDVTANKIYTLSETSKKALESIDQEIKLYLFGIEEENSVVGLVKQYCEANDKISYEMLSSESNLEKVQEFELEDGYPIVVVESGNSKKIIDTRSEFTSYDYTTYAQIDTTEQTLTNSILSLGTENKPKVYFVQGHEEFAISTEEGMQAELGVLSTYLKNEAFDISNINLITTGSVPDDCNVLAIISPTTDFLENEANAVIDYIGKGGNLFVTQDVVSQSATFPNLQKILDIYGVSFENGYIFETNSNYMAANYPYVFIPQISSTNEITADIATDSRIWLAYSQKLNFKSDEELQNLKVTKEELLGTTENAMFITDFSTNLANATSTAQTGHFTVSALMTKTIAEGSEEQATEEGEEANPEEKSDKIESKMVIAGNGRFFADYIVEELDRQYPISYIESNKDFAINSIAYLSEKENTLTIRKDMSGTSYVFTATENQNRVVLTIIFTIPIVIILVGILIWRHRKKRK